MGAIEFIIMDFSSNITWRVLLFVTATSNNGKRVIITRGLLCEYISVSEVSISISSISSISISK